MNVASTLPTAFLTLVVLFSTTPSLWAGVQVIRNAPHPQGTFLKIVDANVAESGQKSILLRRPNDDLRVVPLASLPPADQKIIERFESGQAVVEDVQGAQFEILSGKSAARGEKYAILIGVDQYLDPFSHQLNVCGNDMKLLADTFIANGFAEENVFLLTSDGVPPTKERVERLLTTLLPALSPNDAVVVAFSGHGLMLDFNGDQRSYFCPGDMKFYRDSKEKTADSLVARDFVDQALLASPARSKVLICDACRSESFQNDERAQDAPENRAPRAADAATTPRFQDANFCVLSSCMPGQLSFEAPDGEHSVFIWFLNEGLLGYADQDPSTGGDGDENVGVQEAFNYAQRRTRKYVELEFNAAQIPTFSGTIDDDFALTVSVCDQLPPEFQYDFKNSQNDSIAEERTESVKDLLILKYRLKILGFALRAYCDETGALPSARATDKNGKPTHSWRVRLLPFLGEDEKALYAQIRLDEPWDGAWNSQFHNRMPDIFASSPEIDGDAQGLTRFGIVVGEETAWKPGTPARFANIADGTRGTVAFVERQEPVCWMAPDRELTFERIQTEGTSVLKKHSGYCVVGTLDGSVRCFPQTIAPQDLEAILTSNGGEPLLPSWSPARR